MPTETKMVREWEARLREREACRAGVDAVWRAFAINSETPRGGRWEGTSALIERLYPLPMEDAEGRAPREQESDGGEARSQSGVVGRECDPATVPTSPAAHAPADADGADDPFVPRWNGCVYICNQGHAHEWRDGVECNRRHTTPAPAVEAR